jgi:hypothetical protein
MAGNGHRPYMFFAMASEGLLNKPLSENVC